jgi:hypothetical protein
MPERETNEFASCFWEDYGKGSMQPDEGQTRLEESDAGHCDAAGVDDDE